MIKKIPFFLSYFTLTSYNFKLPLNADFETSNDNVVVLRDCEFNEAISDLLRSYPTAHIVGEVESAPY